MIIVVDNREQLPWAFSDAVQVEYGTLKIGDYSLKGFEDQVVIERKSLNDFLGSISGGRERFEKELRALRGFQLPILLIESDWPTIINGDYGHRQIHPNAVLGSLLAFTVKYGVTPILGGDRTTSAVIAEKIFHLWTRMIEQSYKKLSIQKLVDVGLPQE